MPTTEYVAPLYSDDAADFEVELVVRFTVDRRGLRSYAVVLRARIDGEWRNVRLYDNAHGQPEMHRYTLDGDKMVSEPQPESSTQEGFEAAKRQIRSRWVAMTQPWRH